MHLSDCISKWPQFPLYFLFSVRWEALQMQVGRLWEAVLTLRWAVSPQTNSHRREKVCLSGVPQPLHAQWPPGQACPATPRSSQEDTRLGFKGPPLCWPHSLHKCLTVIKGSYGDKGHETDIERLYVAECQCTGDCVDSLLNYTCTNLLNGTVSNLSCSIIVISVCSLTTHFQLLYHLQLSIYWNRL